LRKVPALDFDRRNKFMTTRTSKS